MDVPVNQCPTCGQGLVLCGTPYPPSLADLDVIPCRLPIGHLSVEHWHPPLWKGAPHYVWTVEPAEIGTQ